MIDASSDGPPPTPSFVSLPANPDTSARRRQAGRWIGKYVVTIILVLTFMFADVQLRYASRIRSHLSELPHAPIAIVLGASVKRDGSPSSALRDRMDTGIELFKKETVDRLLLTGDDGAYHVDEMSVMTRYVRDRGIPDNRVLVDGHGYRTYESCKHAKNELGTSRAIIVTQRFHLGRALYICRRLGIDLDGVVADRTRYDKIVIFWLREIPASIKAWWDVNVRAPNPPTS